MIKVKSIFFKYIFNYLIPFFFICVLEYPSPTFTPVHEADRTHSAPSRHSLIAPTTIQTPATPYIGAQPQYVYVQAAGPDVTQNQPEVNVRYVPYVSSPQAQ